MAEEELDIEDIEHAVLDGTLARIEKDDPRGVKYVIEGKGLEPMVFVGVVARFTELERCLVITVYRISDPRG